jgi:BirA family transcriptional regulator, biotin operon repressor / biotin---[acetyl-CoA-carboxylase] ligase
MSNLKHPAVLINLGQAGETGLALNSDPQFQQELDLCREWGFQLHTTNDRVSLCFDHDQLVPYWVEKEAPAIAWDRLGINGYLRVESTNSEALDLAKRGAPGATLIYAEEQTAGRGRKNRAWHSPAGAGLYFTLILRPKTSMEFWPLLTHVSSVALFETLRDLSLRGLLPSPLEIDLKWPNDVLLSGKKCAGILLESMLSDMSNPAAVVGLGINVRKGSVPENLTSEAICLDEIAQGFVPRRRLLVHFLRHFQLCYLLFEQGKHDELLERWKSCSSMYEGVPIWMGKGETRREAITCGLNEMGALMVRTSDGTRQTIVAEDISIKRILRK